MSTVDAWEAFQRGEDAVGVRDEVLTSWRRSRWSGVDPRLDVPPVGDADDDSPFVRVAAPILLGMADLLAESRTCLSLADPNGHVVWRWVSDRALSDECDRSGMQFASVFDEQRVGTCGIGAALETGRLVTVHGPEHFVESFQRWSCVAAAVAHPITGRTVGAVNVTCRAADANHFLQVAARSLADEVRSALSAAATAREHRLLQAFLHARRSTTAPVLAVTEEVLLADAAAAELGLDHADTWARVVAAGAGGSVVALGGGLVADVCPVGDDRDGAVLTLRSTAPIDLSSTTAPQQRPTARRLTRLEQAESAAIAATLAECGGNKSAAAVRLGISRGTLYQKLRRYRPLTA
ncbi:helix-turn-helix domain-containing protein [Blastococcus saxobsidens]|uniref:Putative Fis family transcriptional regulator n=1 Tax=Blastococcus saxobsidens (strain DD2) TaxID=1146883 RepID=H6RLJ2_BLASD|nr:helix-turn-helix domain-containing protein [Blastococcus saxobsidens]CCG03718.1 Putative Fis family transcriptional regulator [Blastococcus saxobsidens DD2]